MRKNLLLVTVFLFSSIGLAVNPGSTVQLEDYNVGVNSSSPLDAYSNISGVFVDVPIDQDSGIVNQSVDYGNESNTSFYSIEVDSFADWSFVEDEVVTEASVLSGGQVNLSLFSEGNSVENVFLESQGNISELDFQLQSPVTTVPNETVSVANGFSVARSQDFGWYNGTVTGSGGQFNVDDSVNVSIKVFDNIDPVIDSSSFSDFMALQEQEFKVEASDNLQVSNVSGRIWFETSERVGNDTVEVNETLKEISFDRKDNGVWSYVFKDSDEDKKYFYSFTVTDSSGNALSENGSFEVSRLDSVNILRNDFQFKDTRPRTDDSPDRKVSEEIFEKEFEKDLRVGLESFSHRKNNSSMSIGIRERSEDNLRFLYRDGENMGNVTVSEPGRYVLEVFSDSQGDTYSGDLKLYPVAQHKELENGGVIRFGGTVVDPEYPELPENRSIGDFQGRMEFLLNENGVPTGIRFVGENIDIEGCKGAESWSNCIPGYTLGELPDVKQKSEENKAYGDFWGFWGKLGVFFGFLLFPVFSGYNRFSRGTFMTEPKIPKQFVGQQVQSLKDVKLKRRDKEGGLMN